MKCSGRSLFKCTHRGTPPLILSIYSYEQEQYVFHQHELGFGKYKICRYTSVAGTFPCTYCIHTIFSCLYTATLGFSRSNLDTRKEKHFSRSEVHLNGKCRTILISYLNTPTTWSNYTDVSVMLYLG